MDTSADKKLELSIARMLRFGVIVSAAIVLLGGVLYLTKAPAHIPDYTHFHAATVNLGGPMAGVRGVSILDPYSVMLLGILILISTPVVRVIFCIVGFSLQKDRLYIAVSAAVLMILIYSLLRGGR